MLRWKGGVATRRLWGIVLLLLLEQTATGGTTDRILRFSVFSAHNTMLEQRHCPIGGQNATLVDPVYRGYGTLYVNLWVGCPNPQRQTLIVDTGSSKIAFPCEGCEDPCGVGYHMNPLYRANQSTCFRKTDCDACWDGTSVCHKGLDYCPVGQGYVGSSRWDGFEVSDQVYIGGENAQPVVPEKAFQLHFACQTRITGHFRWQLVDGILGMGCGETSNFLRQAYSAGVIESQQFSLCFVFQEGVPVTKAGTLLLGGDNESLHDTAMVYANQRTRGWDVTIESIYFRVGSGHSILPPDDTSGSASIEISAMNETRAAVDSGTTYTYLPRHLRRAFLEAWSRATHVPFGTPVDNQKDFDSLPTIIFQLQGHALQENRSAPGLQGESMLVAFPPSRYTHRCSIGRSFCLFFGDMLNDEDFGIFGANLMAGHDVLFDADNGRIGFAESRCGREQDAAIEFSQKTASPTFVPTGTNIAPSELGTPSASMAASTPFRFAQSWGTHSRWAALFASASSILFWKIFFA